VRAGAEGRLDEGAAQPAVPFARPAGDVFAGTLVVARAEAGPAGQMPGGGEHAHIDAHISDEDLGGPLVDAADGVEPGEKREVPYQIRP